MASPILSFPSKNQASNASEQAFRESVFLAALPALIAAHGSDVYGMTEDDVADVTNSAWNFADKACEQRAEYIEGDDQDSDRGA